MVDHKIVKGMSIIYNREINAGDTATSFGSGVLDYLLSTPAIVNMVSEGAIKLLDNLVPNGYITVGGRIEIVHEKPTLLGESVHVILTVEEVAGNKVALDVTVHDQVGVIARGKHDRFIVESEQLMNAAYDRLGREME